MKTKVVILALLCLCLSQKIFAQNGNGNKGKIYGTVKDSESGNPLEFATAVLLKESDSTVVSSSISDPKGMFTFNNVSMGKYNLKLVTMGYLNSEMRVELTSDKKEINTGTILLKPVNNELGAAVVTAKVPLIERKIDKLIMNVEGAVSTEGSNALDILKKAPGVTVDHDDNVKLLGTGVLVQIDGKNTHLSSSDLAALLNSMDASEITKIEIINSPGSSQEASGSGGIINIRTKKSIIAGVNGNINAGFTAAKHWGYYGGGRLNFRNSWMGAYASANYRNSQGLNTIEQTRNYNQATIPSTFYSFSDSRFKGQNINYRVGLDFYLNPKNTLGFLVTGNNKNEESSSIANTSNTYKTSGIVESKSDANNLRDDKNTGITLNANYRKQFNKDGQELTADFDYVRYNNKQNEDRNNHFYDLINNRDSTWLIYTNSPRDIDVFSGKVDYKQPLGKTAQLEAGAKISYSSTNSKMNWKNNYTGTWENDPDRSNEFEYDERVTAAYASWGKQFNEKWSIKAGLRWENTWSKGYSPTTSKETVRNYNDFFPTLFVQYKPWEKHDFSFNYNRRIQRPNYDLLNPFRFYIDAYTYIAGNENLKPQYTNNLNLSHSYRNMLITTLMYQGQTDIIMQTPEQSTELGESGVIQDNFGYNNMVGISISIPQLPVTKWYTMSASVWGAWSHAHSRQGTAEYDNYQFMAQGYLSNSFTFLKTWRAEASFNATTPASWGFFKTKAQYWMSFGFKKGFYDGKLNLSVNFDDPFKLSKSSMDVKYDKYDIHYDTRWMSQRVRFGLVWRFGSTTVKPMQDRKGGNEDEMSRIKSE